MFGDRLKLARKKAGYSLRGIEEAIDKEVSAQAVGKYERGEMMPISGVLLRLASILDVNICSAIRLRNLNLSNLESFLEQQRKIVQKSR